MNNLMCSVHLMATDSQFQAAFEADSKLALAQRGLTLGEMELKALRRVWSLVKHQDNLPGIPEVDWIFKLYPSPSNVG